jgi:recombinational DNA repair protein RecR
MHNEDIIKEATEICDQINSLFDRLKHLINEPRRCPICLEPSPDGICEVCRGIK